MGAYVQSAGAETWAQGLFLWRTHCQPGDHPDLFTLIIALLQSGTRAMLWVFHAQQDRRIAVDGRSGI